MSHPSKVTSAKRVTEGSPLIGEPEMGDLLQEGWEDLQEEKVFELIVLKQLQVTTHSKSRYGKLGSQL